MSESRYEQVAFTHEHGVARLMLNRQDTLNALSPEMLLELRSALRRADGDPAIRVVVLSGAGRAFCSGGDIAPTEPRTAAGIPARRHVGEYMLAMRQELLEWHQDYLLIAELAKPVIAAVQGWCLGGGSWLAVAADVTIAADDAVFGQPEVRQGMPSGVIWALAGGWKNALRYALTGDRLDATEAMRIGLVNEVVPAAILERHVAALAARIAALPPESSALNKLLIRRSMDAMGFRQALLSAADSAGWLMGAWSPEAQGRFEATAARDGFRAAVRERDEPFAPEDTRPRSTG